MSNDDTAIRMQAAELAMRHNAGNRFRLVEMTYMEPSRPPQVGGQWPLITDVWQDKAWRRPPFLYATEALPGEAYEAYPDDVVMVIPVHPEQAFQTVQGVRGDCENGAQHMHWSGDPEPSLRDSV